jgi:hypothetical protein
MEKAEQRKFSCQDYNQETNLCAVDKLSCDFVKGGRCYMAQPRTQEELAPWMDYINCSDCNGPCNISCGIFSRFPRSVRGSRAIRSNQGMRA